MESTTESVELWAVPDPSDSVGDGVAGTVVLEMLQGALKSVAVEEQLVVVVAMDTRAAASPLRRSLCTMEDPPFTATTSSVSGAQLFCALATSEAGLLRSTLTTSFLPTCRDDFVLLINGVGRDSRPRLAVAWSLRSFWSSCSRGGAGIDGFPPPPFTPFALPLRGWLLLLCLLPLLPLCADGLVEEGSVETSGDMLEEEEEEPCDLPCMVFAVATSLSSFVRVRDGSVVAVAVAVAAFVLGDTTEGACFASVAFFFSAEAFSSASGFCVLVVLTRSSCSCV